MDLGGGHTKTARGTCLGAVCNSASECSVVPGLHPVLFSLSDRCCRVQVRILIDGGSSPGDGGDEETRTPDPLLAKEMLCQLSYVPSNRRWWWAFLDSNQRPLPYQGSALTS
jgi:hypothetical protein